jgi:hypothetical protein
MNSLSAKSGRDYTPLPIESNRGFPQTFSFTFAGQIYYFRLYVNISSQFLDQLLTPTLLPNEYAFLVLQVERDTVNGSRETIFCRKIVPYLEYETELIALTFSTIKIARPNLNGQGDFGSQVTGGIAQRWV